MAEYLEPPLARTLGIESGSRVALVAAPAAFVGRLGQLPAGVTFVSPEDGAVDVMVCFSTDHADLAARFHELKPFLADAGSLWIAWPRKVPGVPFDLIENQVRDIGVAAGLVDSRVCAIDETWSGLRFGQRRAERPKA